MFKLAYIVLASAFAVSATPKPVVVAPAVVTAQSSQYIARNYNALVTPVVAQPIAPVIAEPVIAKNAAYVAEPVVAKTAAYIANPAAYIAQPVFPQTAAYFAQPVAARTSAYVAEPLVAKTAAYVAEPVLAQTAPAFHPSAAYFAQNSQPALAKTTAFFPESDAEKTAAPNAKMSAAVEANPAAETFEPVVRSASSNDKESDPKEVNVDVIAKVLAPSVLAASYAAAPVVSYYNPYFAAPYGSEPVFV